MSCPVSGRGRTRPYRGVPVGRARRRARRRERRRVGELMSETLHRAPVPAARTASNGHGRFRPATVRTQVTVPLRFTDGYTATGRVFSFDGLVDDGEHVAIGLGEWQAALDRSAAGGPAPVV